MGSGAGSGERSRLPLRCHRCRLSGGISNPAQPAAPPAAVSRTIRQPSPLIPLPPCGDAKGRVAVTVFPSCWAWPAQAAATVGVPAPGRLKLSRRAGLPSLWITMTNCSDSFAPSAHDAPRRIPLLYAERHSHCRATGRFCPLVDSRGTTCWHIVHRLY